MDVARQTVIDIIQRMPNDQVMKVLSFAKFVENEETELWLSDVEEDEIVYLLANEEKVDYDAVVNDILREQE
ncbi:MAG: hypothetical protein FWC90_00615 [Oscillospiraceae bacterium]|nr:hypothetical protein [Oscillospiraceae bacterium]